MDLVLHIWADEHRFFRPLLPQQRQMQGTLSLARPMQSLAVESRGHAESIVPCGANWLNVDCDNRHKESKMVIPDFLRFWALLISVDSVQNKGPLCWNDDIDDV